MQKPPLLMERYVLLVPQTWTSEVMYSIEETTEQLEGLFFEDLKQSKRVTEDYFNNISPLIKAFEAFCRIFSSML